MPEYPEVALREAIINAVCHRDYFDKRANVIVEVFADRVVITNPGGLPSGLSPRDFGTKSVARNPLVASLLHRIDYIERIGTGIERIRQAVVELDGCTVDIQFNDFYTVTFHARRRSAQALPAGAEKAAEKAAEKILRLLENAPSLTIAELAERTGITASGIEKSLARLRERGRLKRVGGRRKGYWQVI